MHWAHRRQAIGCLPRQVAIAILWAACAFLPLLALSAQAQPTSTSTPDSTAVPAATPRAAPASTAASTAAAVPLPPHLFLPPLVAPSANWQRANELMAAGDLPTVRLYLDNLLKEDPSLPGLALVLETASRTKIPRKGVQPYRALALKLAMEQSQAQSKNPLPHVMLAKLSLEDRDMQRFRHAVANIEDLFPQSAYAYYYSGLAAFIDGRYAAAAQLLHNARRAGVPLECLEDVRARAMADQQWVWSYTRWTLWILGLWAFSIAVIYVAGNALSGLTLQSLQTMEPTSVSEGWLLSRHIYRIVIHLAGLLYSISLPVLMFVAIVLPLSICFGIVMTPGAHLWLLVAMLFTGMLGALVAVSGIRAAFPPGVQADNGRELAPTEGPRLWELVRDMAERVNVKPVDEIQLTPDTRLTMAERNSYVDRMQGRGQRVLYVGLGLLDDFPLDGFCAIVAAEYGKFIHRETAGGDVAARVLAKMELYAKAIEHRGAVRFWDVVALFFQWYHRMFERITIGAARLQSLIADHDAVQVTSALALERGVSHVTRRTAEFDLLVSNAILDRLRGKPTEEHFFQTARLDEMTDHEQVEDHVRQMMRQTSKATDRHLSPPERFAYARRVPPLAAFQLKGNVLDTIEDRESLTEEIDREYVALLEAQAEIYKAERQALIREITEYLAGNPNVELIVKRATLHMELGQYREALDDLSRALELEPGNAEYQFGRGLNYMRLEQFESAAKQFAAALPKLSGDQAVETQFNYALTCAKLERYEEAIKGFTAVMADGPTLAALVEQARAREALGDWAGSLEELEEAANLWPYCMEIKRERERLRARLGPRLSALKSSQLGADIEARFEAATAAASRADDTTARQVIRQMARQQIQTSSMSGTALVFAGVILIVWRFATASPPPPEDPLALLIGATADVIVASTSSPVSTGGIEVASTNITGEPTTEPTPIATSVAAVETPGVAANPNVTGPDVVKTIAEKFEVEAKLVAESKPARSERRSLVRGEATWSNGARQTPLALGRSAAPVVFSADGRSFYAVSDAGNEVLMAGVSDLGVTRVWSPGGPIRDLARSRSHVLAVFGAERELALLDPASLNLVQRLALPKIERVIASPSSNTCFCVIATPIWGQGKPRPPQFGLVGIDLETGAIEGYPEIAAPEVAALTPNGTYLLTVAQQKVRRYKIEAGKLIDEHIGPQIVDNNHRPVDLVVAPDSTYFAVPAIGGNLRLPGYPRFERTTVMLDVEDLYRPMTFLSHGPREPAGYALAINPRTKAVYHTGIYERRTARAFFDQGFFIDSPVQRTEKAIPTETRMNFVPIEAGVSAIFAHPDGRNLLLKTKDGAVWLDLPRIDAPLVDFARTPPNLPALSPLKSSTVRHAIPLASPARAVVAGGGGRYLCFSIPAKRQVAIFDVQRSIFVKFIPVEQDISLAASAEKLIIYSHERATFARWDLNRLELEKEEAAALEHPLLHLAIGASSAGPIMVASGFGTTACRLSLFDLDTLSPIDIELPAPLRVTPDMGLEASADGRTFALSRTPSASLNIWTISDQGLATATSMGSYFEYILPSANGELLMTPRGIWRTSGGPTEFAGERDRTIPGQQGTSFLTLAREGWEWKLMVHLGDTPGPVSQITGLSLPRLVGVDRATVNEEHRLFYIPAARVVVAIYPKEMVVASDIQLPE